MKTWQATVACAQAKKKKGDRGQYTLHFLTEKFTENDNQGADIFVPHEDSRAEVPNLRYMYS